MQGIISVGSLIHLEAVVCSALNWEFIVPNAIDFINLLCERIFDAGVSHEVYTMCLLELEDYYCKHLLPPPFFLHL